MFYIYTQTIDNKYFISYFISIYILLYFYITSTYYLYAILISLIASNWQRSKGLAHYSHLGNEIFPAWEQNIPTLGIFDKLRVILNKGPLLKNNLPVSENKEALRR